jgi:hypothetical protein
MRRRRLIQQRRISVQHEQVRQRDVGPHFRGLPGPLGQQVSGDQPPHAAAVFLHHDGRMGNTQADRAKARLRAGVYARLSETYDAAESVPTQVERGTDHAPISVSVEIDWRI